MRMKNKFYIVFVLCNLTITIVLRIISEDDISWHAPNCVEGNGGTTTTVGNKVISFGTLTPHAPLSKPHPCRNLTLVAIDVKNVSFELEQLGRPPAVPCGHRD